MYHRQNDFGLFGITDWCCDHYGFLAVLIGLISLISFLLFGTMPWWCAIISAPFVGWGGPICLIFLFTILELVIWYLLHPVQTFREIRDKLNSLLLRCTVRKIISWTATFTAIALGIIIPFNIARFCASKFAEPQPWKWECVYVSESPHAKSYHWDQTCAMLSRTRYDIVEMWNDDAEEEGLTPCKVCAANSVKNEYDIIAIFFVFPTCFLMAKLFDNIAKIFKNYTFRNPIIKKTEYETRK